MAITVTNSTTQPIVVVAGETYIIDPTVTGGVKFEADSGDPTPVDFTVQLNESPSDPSKSVKIETYGSDGALSPTLEVADDYTGPNTEIDFSKAADSTIVGGDNVELKEVKGSKDGDDDITFGDDATIKPSKTIDLGDGDNTLTVGDNLSGGKIESGDGDDDIVIGEDATLKEIKTGKGADEVTLGDGAQLDKLDMGEGQDVARLGELAFAKPSSKITLDGGSKGIDQDCLFLDTSWLSAAEEQRFLDLLEDNGYVFDPLVGGYVEGDDGGADPNFKQTFTLELDSGNKIKFKDWEEIKVVCFARGTRIATVRGELAIEDLRPGDRVLTMDNGYQEIRWIGSSRVAGHGHLAPVRIKAGALNNERDLLVSPQHRILVKGTEIEMMFGEVEALVAAKHLVNGHDIVAEAADHVEYYHMLFEGHEIVFAEGAPSESFHPGAVGLGGMTDATRREIIELFPELEVDVEAYGPSCRRSLRGFEAKAALKEPQVLHAAE